jgi:CheY-like chemotaxis protein/HPt (histidine-containing phosphotransfer) domain-containing protein
LLKPLRSRQVLDAILRLLNAKHPVAEPSAKRAPDERTRFAGCHVLVVEDNPVNQEVVSRLLERVGCRVDLADNGADALNQLTDRQFDVVLMDCEMPVMDGLTATKEQRARERRDEHQVIVALTAHAIPAERDRCIAAGMDDYLSKPIRVPALCDALERWWQRKEPPERGQASEAGFTEDAQAMRPVAPNPALAATEAAPGDDPALDVDVIERLREALGDISTVVAAALEDLPKRVSGLDEAVTAGDVEQVRMLAHQLAGSMSNFGAHRLADEARRLEAAAKTLDLSDAPTGVRQIRVEAGRVEAELRAMSSSPAQSLIRGGKIRKQVESSQDRRS